MSVDLKDDYFHIQIYPRHRHFVRFSFKIVAYQFTVLPFGLSLASAHIHQVHEHRSLSSSSEHSTCCELFGRMAAYGSSNEPAVQPQRSAYQPPSVFGAYDQPTEKPTPAHAMYSISGPKSELYFYARPPAFTGYHELACDVQRRQVFSGMLLGTTSHVATSTMVESTHRHARLALGLNARLNYLQMLKDANPLDEHRV